MAKRSKKKTAVRDFSAGKPAPAPRAKAGFDRDLLFWPLIAVALFITYSPMWNAGFVWDDDAHITRADLQSLTGLWRIWFDPSATQQYYPVVHSIFWFEHQAWGGDPTPYHLVNILLQSISAFLLLKVLRFLEIPGAWFAAAIFALHPVEVETVAWATELKNLLSGIFYFSSALLYLHFDRSRNSKLYAASLGLLSKSVIATMPAALLVIFWWQRGKISWRRDAQPLIPFFAVGLACGLVTAWLEKHFIGAEGAEFNISLIDRFLIAGRNVWFYSSKLLWPQHLIFIYPRWQIAAAVWWQYLFPLAAVVLGGVLLWLAVRRGWRTPLAGYLYFVGTLFPALGFLNVYPFRYSFVADHFQYLAGLGIIVPCAAGLTLLFMRFFPQQPWLRRGPALALLFGLGLLSWHRTWAYQDLETLWRDTIAQNPNCWLACNDLGTLIDDEGQIDAAIVLYKQAIKIYPGYAKAFTNLGYTAAQKGNMTGALAFYERALQLDPRQPEALNNLGLYLAQQGKLDEAMADFEKAAASNPHFARPHGNLGTAYMEKGEPVKAIAEYQAALALDPFNPQLENDLAKAEAAASGALHLPVTAGTPQPPAASPPATPQTPPAPQQPTASPQPGH